MGTPEARALIVAGPTASGKSQLALDLARRWGGTVINADSMQVYAELRVLTARPTPSEEARVPHRLYGVRPAAQPGSVGWWRQAVLAELQRAWSSGSVPILCGGTGMYLAALIGGIADIPDPGPQARQAARALLTEIGPRALHEMLARADPRTAATLRPSDSQRIARAWEVLSGTGHGLAHWQEQGGTPAAAEFAAIWLDPPRPALRAAIAERLHAMLGNGALAEVASLLAQNLDPALPAMRAHGVPEFSAHLRGEVGLDEARARTEAATARYTRRQATWLRHHTLAPARYAHRIDARYAGLTQFSQSQMNNLDRFVRGDG